MDEIRTKAIDILDPCSECNVKPELWEETFFGVAGRKFIVACPKCGKKTEYFVNPRTAVNAWNHGAVIPKRQIDQNIDDDGLVDMMGHVMARAVEDYELIASREYLTRWDKARIKEIEEFVYENPYMLPYDREYMLEKMNRIVEAKRKKYTRKTQVS